MTSWPNGSKTIPRVTSEYGSRVDPISGATGWHDGIDLIGFAINRAPEAGQVILASYNGGAGNEVRIRGNSGTVFRIMHNASFLVAYGQWVAEGAPVGVQGTTGYSTGVHCHLGVFPGGGASVNPRDYMARAIPAGLDITPLNEQDDDMSKTQYYYATDNGGLAVNVGQGDWWCRESATAPLRRLTNDQASAAFLADGISSGPFNFPQVQGKPGAWFVQAFKDDATVEHYSVDLTHPYLTHATAIVEAGDLKVPTAAEVAVATADELARRAQA